MDPRIQLYADIVQFKQIQRFEFSSWTPIEPRFSLLKNKLHTIIDSLAQLSNIPAIRRPEFRCFRCAKRLKNHRCLQKPCKGCGFVHEKIECRCQFECKSCCVRGRSAGREVFEKMCTNEQINLIRCIKCRKVGHICQQGD